MPVMLLGHIIRTSRQPSFQVMEEKVNCSKFLISLPHVMTAVLRRALLLKA